MRHQLKKRKKYPSSPRHKLNQHRKKQRALRRQWLVNLQSQLKMTSVSCKKKAWKLHSRQDALLVCADISMTKCLKIIKCLNQEKHIPSHKQFGLELSSQTKRLVSLLEIEILTRNMLPCSIGSSMSSTRQIVVSDSKAWPCRKFWIVARVISLGHSKTVQ